MSCRTAVVWLTMVCWVSSGVRPVWASSGPPSEDPAVDPAALSPADLVAADDLATAPQHHCDKQPVGTRFRITLPREAELDDLVHWMMSVSCRSFVWEPGLRRGKVTILAPDVVTLTEAFAVFHAALQTMGLAIEAGRGFEKIVESVGAENRVLPVYEPGHEPPEDDRYVTQLIRTSGRNTQDVVALVTALKSKQGAVQSVDDLVIVSDTGANVRRLLTIVGQLDDPELVAQRVFFRQLEHAPVDAVAETVRQLFGDTAAQPPSGKAKARAEGSSPHAQAARVMVDIRTNTLVVVATAADWELIRPLVAKLDVQLPGGSGRIHVVRVINADVERVAEVLNGLSGGAPAKDGKGAPSVARALGEGLTGEIRVTADPDTRALVVMASPSDFIAVERVIHELDIERRQVYIEVFLLELSTDKNLALGASAHFGSTAGGSESAPGVGFVSSQQGDANSFALSPSALSGLAAGVIGPAIPGSAALTGTDVDIPSFGVVIQALQTQGDVNFVADTHLYTADNKTGKIEVGGSKPTLGATQLIPVGGGVSKQQSIERIKAALSLEVTPHVHDARTVSLDIKLNNESFGAADELGIPTNTRKLELEQVLARDDQPLILGGLVQERETITQSEVPGLGRIPLIGWMFKSKKRRTEKVNMLMILVPHILESPEDARRIHKRRMEERLEFLERYTAFKRRDLDTHVNYRRKSGLLATVDAEARRMRTEASERAAASRELEATPVDGDLGLAPMRALDQAPTTASGPTSPPSAAPVAPSGASRPRPGATP